MTTYEIYDNSFDLPVVLKDGWSWPAFCFPGIWSLVYKLWKQALVLVGINLAVMILLSNMLPVDVAVWIYYGFSILQGLPFAEFGHKWRKKKLLSDGYLHVATVKAGSKKGAFASWQRSINPTEIGVMPATADVSQGQEEVNNCSKEQRERVHGGTLISKGWFRLAIVVSPVTGIVGALALASTGSFNDFHFSIFTFAGGKYIGLAKTNFAEFVFFSIVTFVSLIIAPRVWNWVKSGFAESQ